MKIFFKSIALISIIISLFTLSSIAQLRDESDKKLSIIVPKAVAMDIDFGKVLVGSMKDSVFRNYIRNTGDSPIRIEAISIEGKDAREFMLVSGIPPFVIGKGKSKNIEFRFKPAVTGMKKAKIKIITQIDSLIYNISGEGVEPKLKVITEIIDFGKIPMYSQEEKTIKTAIKNIGSGNLQVNNVVLNRVVSNQFSLNQRMSAFVLKPDESMDISVRFTPIEQGRTSGEILVYYGLAPEPAKIKLYGEGMPVFATIQGIVSDVNGEPLVAGVGWELIRKNTKNIELGTTESSSNGKYIIKVPIGKNYIYFFSKKGYSGVSEMAELSGQKKEITITKNIILKKPWDGSIAVNNIFFDYNKSDLKPESYSVLDRLVDLLKEYPNVKVEISGHTDNIGNDDYNQRLSESRASSVVNYLTKKGIKKSNLVPKGYGKSKPVADNKTEEGRAKNRRVEFRFLK